MARDRQIKFSVSAAIAAAILMLAVSSARAKSADPHGGLWSRLEKRGISIGLGWAIEGFDNFKGGIKSGQDATSTLDLRLGLDLQRLLGLPGGTFCLNLEDHAGRNPSSALVGDFQVFDKQNNPPYFQIFELWYQQSLFNGKLRFKIGKVDANTEFSVIDNGLEFLNSSSQVSPTLFVFPTTPDPMPSINVFWAPTDSFDTAFGAYYANRSVRFGNFSGNPQDHQLSDNGVFLIGQAGPQWSLAPIFRNDGSLKVGVWGHTGTFTRFDGSRQRGAGGYYAILNQTLWQPPGEPTGGRGLRGFLVCGRTEQSVSPIDRHIGVGVAWKGPFSARPDDVLGFTPQYAHISPRAGLPHAYELALEAFYKLRITRRAAIMPDLQYIIHPGGRYPDALVGILRLTVNL
jgi:porin